MNSRDTLATELNVLADFNPVVPENYKEGQLFSIKNFTHFLKLLIIESFLRKNIPEFQ